MRDNILHNGNFLALWTGESVSLFGSQITALALPVTAVRLLHASPMQMGLLQASQFAPFLLVTVIAGVLVDRYAQRPILLAANLASGAAIALVPLASAFNALDMPLLYLISAIAGVSAVFLNLSFTSLLPAIVGAQHLLAANAKLEQSRNAAQMIGPAAAAALVNILSAPTAMLFNAATFLIGGTSVAMVRACDSRPAATAAPGRFLREIADGLHATFGNVHLVAMTLVAAAFNFFFQAMATLFVLYAVRGLAMNNTGIAFVFTAESIGGLIGASIAGAAARAMGLGRSLVLLTFFGCAGLSLVPLARAHSPSALTLCAAGYFFMGLGISAFNVQTITLRAVLAPAHLLGRVNASARALVFGAIPLGALIAGFAAQRLGVYAAVSAGAVGLLLTWAVFAASPIRTLPTAAAAAT